MKLELEKQENLEVKQGLGERFIVENNKIIGIESNFGDRFYAKSIIIASGTFLNGKLHYGLLNMPGGRAGDPPSVNLSDSLKNQLGLRIGRLKTGTPPRVLAKTIDFSQMRLQEAEYYEEYFSFQPEAQIRPRAERRDMPCYLVYSTEKTAEVVNANLDKAPMYQGNIEGIGTRYCPSFEDKVVRFPHHGRHLLYMEPEGEYTEEYYLNGISTSLPPEVQIQMLHSIPGLEKARISRYAYAIEYDFVFPDQIERSLAVKKWPNLFLAGQINGTSGYEEAAGQGLIAGLNAAKYAGGESTVELARDSSYIGVMIDDLVTKDIIEPYRLFTSRAEYRLRLRQDNADLRLYEFAYRNGLVSAERHKQTEAYAKLCQSTEALCREQKLKGKTLWELLRDCRGKMGEKSSFPFPLESIKLDIENHTDKRVLRQLLINAHYEGYLKREASSVLNLKKLEDWRIPVDFDYQKISGLRNESRMKLLKVAPTTLAQASRIDGVTPAEIALLQVHLTRQKESEKTNLKEDNER
jgi:tRNA uridine 5-carboxymethylaminomethyl modification enzyme